MAKPQQQKQRFNVPMDPRKRFSDIIAPVKVRGRPSGYKKEFCGLAIKLGAEGHGRAAIAASIGICRDQLGRWEEKYSEFRVALREAKALEQLWWEKVGKSSIILGSQLNSAVWAKSMSARFREDYTERNEISGPNGAPIPTKLEIEFVGVKPSKEK